MYCGNANLMKLSSQCCCIMHKFYHQLLAESPWCLTFPVKTSFDLLSLRTGKTTSRYIWMSEFTSEKRSFILFLHIFGLLWEKNKFVFLSCILLLRKTHFFTPISNFSCLIFPPFHHSVPTSFFFSSVTAAGVDSMTSPFPIGLGGMGSTFLTATVAASSSKEPEVEELL